jgi:hypothetical protein
MRDFIATRYMRESHHQASLHDFQHSLLDFYPSAKVRHKLKALPDTAITLLCPSKMAELLRGSLSW